MAEAGLRLEECGTNGAGSLATGDPTAPHSHADKPENGGEESRPHNPGFQGGEIKPKPSD